MTEISITREPDDPIAEVRVSIGRPRELDGIYLIFRGEPERVVETLKRITAVAEKTLPAGVYKDERPKTK